jgi:hypothetical protein
VRGQAQTFGGFKPINGIPILLLIGSPTVNTDKNMLIYMIASIIFVTSISYLCYLFRKQANDNYLYQQSFQVRGTFVPIVFVGIGVVADHQRFCS